MYSHRVNILFPSNPIDPKAVESSFAEEAEAAKTAGFRIGRVDLEILLGGDVKIANVAPDESVLYRGWLMKPEQYERLYAALGGKLLPSPEGYVTAYELPRWYSRLKPGVTPRTLILPAGEWGGFPEDRLGDVAECVEHTFVSRLNETEQAEVQGYYESFRAPPGAPPFSNWHTGHLRPELMELPSPRPVVVKDYVKSAKHRWFDACFIRDSRNREETTRVTKNFLDIQGTGLVGGLCFRQFEFYKPIGIHPKTKLPLVNEWRAFMSKGRVFYFAPYWSDGADYTLGAKPTAHEIESLAVGLEDLELVAVDVAERVRAPGDGAVFDIIEVNPGGAAGVPEGGDVTVFYQLLRKVYPE